MNFIEVLTEAQRAQKRADLEALLFERRTMNELFYGDTGPAQPRWRLWLAERKRRVLDAWDVLLGRATVE